MKLGIFCLVIYVSYSIGKAVPVSTYVSTSAPKTCPPPVVIKPGGLGVNEGIIESVPYFIALIFFHDF